MTQHRPFAVVAAFALGAWPFAIAAQDIRSAPLAQIEADCACDIDEESGGDPAEAITYGLSTMWIDASELTGSTVAGTLYLSGEAETEDGTVDVTAAMIGRGAFRQLNVLLAEPGTSSPPQRQAALRAFAAGPGSDVAEQPLPPEAAASPAEAATPAPQASATDAPGDPGWNAAQRAALPKPTGRYPAPLVNEAGGYTTVTSWPKTGEHVRTARPGDARSPRMHEGLVLPDLTGEQAIEHVLREVGLSEAAYDGVHRPGNWSALTGGQLDIAFGTARRDGAPVRFFVFSTVSKDGARKGGAYEANERDWRAWGGPAIPMGLTGLVGRGDFSPEGLTRYAALSPEEEAAAFTRGIDLIAQAYAAVAGQAMSSRLQTMGQMQDMINAEWMCSTGGVTCVPQPDGAGGYEPSE